MFKKVEKYLNIDFPMPERKTEGSAGYDMAVAKDTVIPSWFNLIDGLTANELFAPKYPLTLEQVKEICKKHAARPTLVPTGVKCYLEPGTYLELSVRSSTPLNSWLMLANGVGIIDSDYVDNEDNEGEIFFQFYNLSPYDIILKKGDIVGQGIIKEYLTFDSDKVNKKRTGGFGSTSKRDYISKQAQMIPADGAANINLINTTSNLANSGNNPLASFGCSISDVSNSIQAISSALENLNYNFEVGV